MFKSINKPTLVKNAKRIGEVTLSLGVAALCVGVCGYLYMKLAQEPGPAVIFF